MTRSQSKSSPFLRAFRGVPAPIVARAMTELVRGINFYGCSKTMLENSWTSRRIGNYGYRSLKRVKLREIVARVEELQKDKRRRG